MGLVESQLVNSEGITAFFRVGTCTCPSFFPNHQTTFPFEGQLQIIKSKTHVCSNSTDFLEMLLEIYKSVDDVILFVNDVEDDDDDENYDQSQQ